MLNLIKSQEKKKHILDQGTQKVLTSLRVHRKISGGSLRYDNHLCYSMHAQACFKPPFFVSRVSRIDDSLISAAFMFFNYLFN